MVRYSKLSTLNCGLGRATMNNYAFEKWVPFLLEMEGGCTITPGLTPREIYEARGQKAFSDNPSDPGGATMMGITLAVYSLWRAMNGHPVTTAADLRAMTYAEWASIVKTYFWDNFRCSQASLECIAVCMADGIFHSGTAGVKDLQRVLGLVPDGIVGRKTVGALQRARSRESGRALCHQLLDARIERLRRLPTYSTFGRGWERRIDALRQYIYHLDLTMFDNE